MTCNHEVVGSNPTVSSISKKTNGSLLSINKVGNGSKSFADVTARETFLRERLSKQVTNVVHPCFLGNAEKTGWL